MLHVSKYFNQNINEIKLQAEKYLELETIIAKYLPLQMVNNFKVASFHDGCLILKVTDAVWASQLRFMLPELRDNLRAKHNLYQLSNLKITIIRDSELSNKINPAKLNNKPSPWQGLLAYLHSTS